MGKIIRSHKIRLRPTEEQKEHLFRACAASRNAWNFGKEILDFEYDLNRVTYRETGEKYKFTHARRLKKLYNKVKPDWIKDRTATATQEAFDDLQRAISRYFDIRTGKIKLNGSSLEEADQKRFKRDGKKAGWPKWRNKHKHNSFRCTYVTFRVDDLHITYNRQVGPIRMCERLRFKGFNRSVTFSWDGEYWYVSIQVEIKVPENPKSLNGAIGIDLGVKYLATDSEGDQKDNPRAYVNAQRKLRRLQRKLDRQKRANNPQNYDEKGRPKSGVKWISSKQMDRTQKQINRLHKRIKNIRRDAQHQITAAAAKNFGLVAIEDLNVSGMLKNKRLSKAIADCGFSEIRRQFEYKAEDNGGFVQVVDRWFPSSKLCSGCGYKNLDLSLNDRFWICPECEQENERDLNAAINLREEGARLFNENNRP
jgi:putative transposase